MFYRMASYLSWLGSFVQRQCFITQYKVTATLNNLTIQWMWQQINIQRLNSGVGFILNPGSRAISVSLVELLLHLQIHIPLWSNQAKSILLWLDHHFTRLNDGIDMVVLYQVFIGLADWTDSQNTISLFINCRWLLICLISQKNLFMVRSC